MSLLNRRDALRALLYEREKMIVVAGLGSSAYDLASCGNEPLDFPLWGAMGGAAMVGLGIALAQPEYKVLVVTGDGEMLMGLGSLATIAAQRPSNLRIVVLDNELFGETGHSPGQRSGGIARGPSRAERSALGRDKSLPRGTPPRFATARWRVSHPSATLRPAGCRAGTGGMSRLIVYM
jgi:hypothetical protein